MTDRFWSKVEKGPGCWLWMGYRNRGYGKWNGRPLNGGVWRPRPAHVVAYERMVGPVPAGLQLDHLCRNPPCVNPEHLEPVTSAENTRRGNGIGSRYARRTHCDRGHPFAGANMSILPNGARRCLTCHREAMRRYARRTPQMGDLAHGR